MTLNELAIYLSEYLAANPDYGKYPVSMVGWRKEWDETTCTWRAVRTYDTPCMDITVSPDEHKCLLWDF